MLGERQADADRGPLGRRRLGRDRPAALRDHGVDRGESQAPFVAAVGDEGLEDPPQRVGLEHAAPGAHDERRRRTPGGRARAVAGRLEHHLGARRHPARDRGEEVRGESGETGRLAPHPQRAIRHAQRERHARGERAPQLPLGPAQHGIEVGRLRAEGFRVHESADRRQELRPGFHRLGHGAQVGQRVRAGGDLVLDHVEHRADAAQVVGDLVRERPRRPRGGLHPDRPERGSAIGQPLGREAPVAKLGHQRGQLRLRGPHLEDRAFAHRWIAHALPFDAGDRPTHSLRLRSCLRAQAARAPGVVPPPGAP